MNSSMHVFQYDMFTRLIMSATIRSSSRERSRGLHPHLTRANSRVRHYSREPSRVPTLMAQLVDVQAAITQIKPLLDEIISQALDSGKKDGMLSTADEVMERLFALGLCY